MQAQNIRFADKLMPDTLYGTEQFGVYKKTGKVDHLIQTLDLCDLVPH